MKYDKKTKQNGNRNFFPKVQRKDPTFYEVSSAITDSVANVPFNVFPGTREQVLNPSIFPAATNVAITDNSSRSTPGALAISYSIAPGTSASATSALNIASKALYTWVRHRNSGKTNYESSDLMLYVLAMQEAYIGWMELVRAWKVAATYEMMNRNVPEVLCRTLGIDGDDFRNNISNYRGQINLLACKLSSLAVPKTFKNIEALGYYASVIFADSDSATSQYYAFVRRGYRVFDPTTEGGGSLRWKPCRVTGHYLTGQEFIDQVNEMVDVLISDEDINIMSGDMVRAFSADDLYILKELEEAATVPIVYDIDILQQIENSMTTPTATDIASSAYNDALSITQNSNVLYFTGESFMLDGSNIPASLYYQILTGQYYYNSHDRDGASSKETLEWMQLMQSVENVSTASENSYTLNVGLVYVHSYSLHFWAYPASGTPSLTSYEFGTCYNGGIGYACKIDKFDWHPILYPYASEAVGAITSIKFYGSFADLKRYTLVSQSVVSRIHDSATMGALGALLLSKYKGATGQNA